MPRFTAEQLEKALRKAGGIQSAAAAILGVARQSVNARVMKTPRLRAICDEVCEEVLDLAESKLIQQIRAGHVTAIIFYLKTKGKHRGYVERQERSGPAGGPLQTQEVAPLDDAARDAEIARLFDRARERAGRKLAEEDSAGPRLD